MWRDVFNYKAFWNGRVRKEKDFRRSANMLSTRPLRLASIILLASLPPLQSTGLNFFASLPPSQSTGLNFFASYFSEKESLSVEPHMPSSTKATDLSGGLVLRRDIQDTVSVNIKADGDLGYSSGCSWDFGELEFSEQVVVPGPDSLSFIHLDQDSGLVVGVG
ncbi:hypothetical protein ACFX2I_041966 [Malus domestica]